MDRELVEATTSKYWPETHPLISLIVLISLGMAFIAWTGMADTVGYFGDWF